MPLNKEQQQLVEDNMALVGGVIKDCVINPNNAGIFTYDDLFQIGCLGLCKAAETYNAGGRAKFDTYAYILIRNETYKKLEYATLRKKREQLFEPNAFPGVYRDEFSEHISFDSLNSVLESAASATTGIISKGITAIQLQAQGLSSKEIAQHFGGVKVNNVTAWMSKARKHLRSIPEIAAMAP